MLWPCAGSLGSANLDIYKYFALLVLSESFQNVAQAEWRASGEQGELNSLQPLGSSQSYGHQLPQPHLAAPTWVSSLLPRVHRWWLNSPQVAAASGDVGVKYTLEFKV